MIYGNKFLPSNEVVEEGATLDYIRIARKYKNVYKENMHLGNKFYKQKDYKEAKKHFYNTYIYGGYNNDIW